MYSIPKENVEAMSELNNLIVNLIDKSPITPLEALMVLQIIQNTISQAFEAHIVMTLAEDEKKEPG